MHRASDEVLRATAGAEGIAATRMLFVQAGRVYRIDADGADAAMFGKRICMGDGRSFREPIPFHQAALR